MVGKSGFLVLSNTVLVIVLECDVPESIAFFEYEYHFIEYEYEKDKSHRPVTLHSIIPQ